MTKYQEWFNTAVAGLASQDFRQSVDDDACKFRGPNGMKCAIGYLISDEQLMKASQIEFESMNMAVEVCNNFYIDPVQGSGGCREPNNRVTFSQISDNEQDFQFLSALQQVHDSSIKRDSMIPSLQNFADSCGLELPEAIKTV